MEYLIHFMFSKVSQSNYVGTCCFFCNLTLSDCLGQPCLQVNSWLNPQLTMLTYGFSIHVLCTCETTFTLVCWVWSMTKPIYKWSLLLVYHEINHLKLSDHLGRSTLTPWVTYDSLLRCFLKTFLPLRSVVLYVQSMSQWLEKNLRIKLVSANPIVSAN
jgi:hypothetical protein